MAIYENLDFLNRSKLEMEREEDESYSEIAERTANTSMHYFRGMKPTSLQFTEGGGFCADMTSLA